jgi:hypothetical protein
VEQSYHRALAALNLASVFHQNRWWLRLGSCDEGKNNNTASTASQLCQSLPYAVQDLACGIVRDQQSEATHTVSFSDTALLQHGEVLAYTQFIVLSL